MEVQQHCLENYLVRNKVQLIFDTVRLVLQCHSAYGKFVKCVEETMRIMGDRFFLSEKEITRKYEKSISPLKRVFSKAF